MVTSYVAAIDAGGAAYADAQNASMANMATRNMTIDHAMPVPVASSGGLMSVPAADLVSATITRPSGVSRRRSSQNQRTACG